MSTGAPEPLQHVAYLFDGSLEGLLSAVFLAYERRESPTDIVREDAYQPRLGQSFLQVTTDVSRAERVRRGVQRQAGRNAFFAIVRASTCDDYDMGAIVYQFVRSVMARPASLRDIPVLSELANPIVANLMRLSKHAVNECEHVRQFARFSHLENGVWYAKVNPNASVVPLVMGHFAARLNDEAFILYDETHHLAGVYDGTHWELVQGDAASVLRTTEHDQLMQQAWQRFYDTLSVDARYNPELRRHFMPVRLWKNLPEMSATIHETC